MRESDTEIYSIGIFDPYARHAGGADRPATARTICQRGDRRPALPRRRCAEMGDIAEKISTELRNQYVIGYTPKDLNRDGKWRKVKVKLNPPPGLPPLTVHARTGYYAPLQ